MPLPPEMKDKKFWTMVKLELIENFKTNFKFLTIIRKIIKKPEILHPQGKQYNYIHDYNYNSTEFTHTIIIMKTTVSIQATAENYTF